MIFYAQPRSLEAFNFLGILPDILKNAVPMYPMRLFKLPGGTEVIRTWEIFPHRDPVPSVPWVRHFYLIYESLRIA